MFVRVCVSFNVLTVWSTDIQQDHRDPGAEIQEPEAEAEPGGGHGQVRDDLRREGGPRELCGSPTGKWSTQALTFLLIPE